MHFFQLFLYRLVSQTSIPCSKSAPFSYFRLLCMKDMFCENSKLIRNLRHHNVVVFVQKLMEVVTEKSKFFQFKVLPFFGIPFFVAEEIPQRQPK